MTPQETDTDTEVRTSVVVSASREHAFSVFTEGIGSWWPPDHHILQGELAEMVFEPRVGGAVYDRATDGTECRWGRVLAYEPPHRFVITWNINLQWQLETSPENVSEIEVTFHSESAATTRGRARPPPSRPPRPRLGADAQCRGISRRLAARTRSVCPSGSSTRVCLGPRRECFRVSAASSSPKRSLST